ncbi:hypothetical protein MFLAVUS_008854 [Mucor flavus]|uniref:Uncharacterized protein n=1 Tax=Mucor flavus TaxID=439312 RepID=A0ABP9Z896_9FUNG
MFIESYKSLKHIFDNEDNALNYLIENKYVNTFDKCGICKAPSSFITSSLQIDKNTVRGRNEIIEIDETKIAKRKYNKGHSVEGAWVIGEPIEERNIENINEIIEKYIKKGYKHKTITYILKLKNQNIIKKNKCSQEIYYDTKKIQDEEYNHVNKNTNIENTSDLNIDDNINDNICDECGFEIDEKGCVCPDNCENEECENYDEDVYDTLCKKCNNESYNNENNNNTSEKLKEELYELEDELSDIEMEDELYHENYSNKRKLKGNE